VCVCVDFSRCRGANRLQSRWLRRLPSTKVVMPLSRATRERLHRANAAPRSTIGGSTVCVETFAVYYAPAGCTGAGSTLQNPQRVAAVRQWRPGMRDAAAPSPAAPPRCTPDPRRPCERYMFGCSLTSMMCILCTLEKSICRCAAPPRAMHLPRGVPAIDVCSAVCPPHELCESPSGKPPRASVLPLGDVHLARGVPAHEKGMHECIHAKICFC